MKKQIKKLNLNKKTILNLNASEMNRQAGAGRTQLCNTERRCTQGCNTYYCEPTQNGHTCNGNNNCV